jgi:hypothetical protein
LGCVIYSLKNGRNLRRGSHFREVGVGGKALIFDK